MGKNLQTEQKEKPSTALSEILYSNNDIIASIDSQLRGGTADSLKMQEGISDSVTNGAKGKVPGFLEASMSSRKDNHETITHSISPHDSKIINLIDDLSLEKTKETSQLHNGKIVLLEGSIQFYNIPHTRRLFIEMKEMGTLREMETHIYKEGEEGVEEFMIGKTHYQSTMEMLNFLPDIPMFIIKLKNNRLFTIPLSEKYLRYDMDILNWLYGSGLSGTWKIVGIFDSSKRNGKEPDNPDVLQSLEIANNAILDVVKSTGLPDEIITPILIYRNLEV